MDISDKGGHRGLWDNSEEGLALRVNAVLIVIPAINADRGGRDCPESSGFAFVFVFSLYRFSWLSRGSVSPSALDSGMRRNDDQKRTKGAGINPPLWMRTGFVGTGRDLSLRATTTGAEWENRPKREEHSKRGLNNYSPLEGSSLPRMEICDGFVGAVRERPLRAVSLGRSLTPPGSATRFPPESPRRQAASRGRARAP